MKYETDLKNLRKNLNLKKFIKTLEPQDFDNQKQIYLDLLQSCSSKKKNADQLEDEYDKNGFNEYLDDLMVGGKFFSTISDNFKLEMDVCVEGEKGLDEFTSYFLISSKVNKTFYVIIYISEEDGNDGFYVAKKFKDKKKAKIFIKNETKID